MTTFVASLHLPYTVHFSNGTETPQYKSSFSPRAASHRRTLSSSSSKSPPRMKFIPGARSGDTVASAPNLLQTLGRALNSISADEPTPPLTPTTAACSPTGEELFFRLSASENAPLGSPSDPSFPRKPHQPKLRVGALPLSSSGSCNVSSGQDSEDGYFPSTYKREKRRSFNSERSSSFSEKSWHIEETDQGNGGLKNAVEAAISSGGLGSKTWVGVLGFPTDGLDEPMKTAIEGRLREDFDSLVAYPSNRDFDGHYNHFCKEILWPVFHYQIPDHPKSKAFLDHSWKYFESVNRCVADVIIKDYKRGDTVWVHDYHLLLVPKMVREALGPEAKIGFFLHVAFPSSEIFRCLAHRRRLLQGMLGATLIGFQTEEYTRHFLQTCSRLLCVEVQDDGLEIDDRFVNVVSLPIGIDPIHLDEKRKEGRVREWMETLRARYAGKKLLVARDKLDGVRGVRQKMLAFELFLKKHPEWIGKVVLIQVALPTTSIVESQSTVIDIVSRINCAYATLEYQPVVYLHQDISYYQYLALLTIADALVVTSLRDGMNLTSHEFVYCQGEKHAPLIMSEFTGSASCFDGAEIPVNPWDHSQCADAIFLALTMSEGEKERRWRRLYKAVTHHTASYWFTTFVSELNHSWEEQQRRGSTAIPRLNTKSLIDAYGRSQKRVFLLDYEGTLVSWGSPTSIPGTGLQRTLETLHDLLLDDRNVVYIMSSRTPEELENLFDRVPGIGLIAESGCFIRTFQEERWIRLADAELPWKKSVKEIIDYYVERTPGAFIEERNCSYILDYEKAEDHILAERQAGECCNHVNDSCEAYRVHAVPLGGAVLVESMEWTKASAAQHALDLEAKQGEPAPDFLLVVGDGRDDEPVFSWANDLGRNMAINKVITVKVGTKNTQAISTITGVSGVLTALHKLASIIPDF